VSGGEVVLLAMIGVSALGGRRLPEAKRLLGWGLQRFQRAVNEVRRSVEPEDRPRRPPRLID
jgi:Sec-independent protein translocase protein TatA